MNRTKVHRFHSVSKMRIKKFEMKIEFAEPHDDVNRNASMLELSTRLSVFPQHQQTPLVSDFEREMKSGVIVIDSERCTASYSQWRSFQEKFSCFALGKSLMIFSPIMMKEETVKILLINDDVERKRERINDWWQTSLREWLGEDYSWMNLMMGKLRKIIVSKLNDVNKWCRQNENILMRAWDEKNSISPANGF